MADQVATLNLLLAEGAPTPKQAHSRRRRPIVLIAVLAVLAIAAGVCIGLIFGGVKQLPQAAPLPASPFSVSPLPVPNGIGVIPAAGQTAGGRGVTAQPVRAIPPHTADELQIPSLNVGAPVITEDVVNSMLTIPKTVTTVGEWSGSAGLTAATGTVLVAGHINNEHQGEGALYLLATIKPHAIIYLTRNNVTTVWQVVSLKAVLKAALPQDVFAGPTGPRTLVVVTCGGDIHNHEYDDNVVVTAVPA